MSKYLNEIFETLRNLNVIQRENHQSTLSLVLQDGAKESILRPKPNNLGEPDDDKDVSHTTTLNFTNSSR